MLFLCFHPEVQAGEPPATFTRFCASCGIRDVESFSSHSLQFVVHGSVSRRALFPLRASTNGIVYIEAEPQLIAVSAERARRALGSELRLPNAFQDKIHIIVFDLAPPGQAIGIITKVHSDGFRYTMSIPAYVENTQLLKGLMQVLMMEYANRSGQRAAELPGWLVEGMLRQIQTTVVPTYVVNRRPLTIETTGYDRLGATRTYFQTNTPLTMQELSFSDRSRFTPEERTRFEASSHLLVHQLLRLGNGPSLMARFLQSLPHALNWQTALYSAYKEHFATPLQFEKWWMLNWMEFSNQKEKEIWPTDVTLDRLESLLLTSMEVRLDANSLPQQRDASLQELLQIAEFPTQKEILNQKLQQLYLMSLSVPSQVLPVWGAYQKTLDGYLQKRSLNEYQPALKSDPGQRLQNLIRSTTKTLDELDQARLELRTGRTPVLPKIRSDRPVSKKDTREADPSSVSRLFF